MPQSRNKVMRIRAILQAMYTAGGDPRFTVNSAISFLTVAANPGLSTREYQLLTGHSQSTMSRHLLNLGPRNHKLETGLELLQVIRDPGDWRQNLVTLTHKGQQVVETLTQLLGDVS